MTVRFDRGNRRISLPSALMLMANLRKRRLELTLWWENKRPHAVWDLYART